MAYRIRITKGGLFGNSGELPIGQEFTLKGKPPAGWAGRYEVVSQTDDKEPVTANGGLSDDRKAAILEAIEGLDPDKDYTKGGKPDVDAINALMPEGSETVTAAERDEVVKGNAASKTKKRVALEDQAKELEVAFDDDTSDEDLIASIKEAKASKKGE